MEKLIIKVTKEDTQIVAECATLDIVVQADTVWDALYELGRLIAAYDQLDGARVQQMELVV